MMSKLVPVVDWIKANPLLMACATVILASMLSFYWPTHTGASQLAAKVEASKSQSASLEKFFNKEVELPPLQPDEPPVRTKLIIKSAAITKLESVYKNLGEEYLRVFERARTRNQQGHNVMMEGLLPEASDLAKPFNARNAYTQSFEFLYSNFLRAGTPPTKEQAQDLMKREQDAYMRQLLLPGNSNLNPAQQAELLKRQADKLVKLYQSTAAKYHIYADTVQLRPGGFDAAWQTGPFQVGDWARQSRRPSQLDIWEGQMQLWIQQDIARAIAIANRVEDPTVTVVEAPVKRLLQIKVKPDYIGLPLTGATEPIDEAAVKQRLSKRLEPDFTISPTGRSSNPLYDVRHATVSLLVESRKIPALFNAIARVNFMTVIGMDMKDIDEFAHLREGYWYGPVDVVQLDLTIETIWLRDWTAGHLSKEHAAEQNIRENQGLMPDLVRGYLGLKPWDAERYQKQKAELLEAARSGDPRTP